MTRKRIAGLVAQVLLIIVASSAAFALNGADPAQPGTQVVTVQGTGVINNGDESAARDAAIQDALRKAVEQVVGTIVPSQTIVQNYKQLNDTIYANTAGYVSDYKIVNEGPNTTTYTVTLQATVGMKHLKNDLSAIGLLTRQKKMPNVAVIILEQNIGATRLASSVFSAPASPQGGYAVTGVDTRHEAGAPSIAENEMIKQLMDSGLNVIDAAVLLHDIKISSGYSLSSLDDTTVNQLGKLANADIVIYGKAVAVLYGRVKGSEMRSAQATVALRAVDTDDGKVLASGEQHAASVHTDTVIAGHEAIIKATDKLAAGIIATILKAWKEQVNSGSLITLAISGVRSAGDLEQVKSQLLSTQGVQNVFDKSAGSGQAAMEVDYWGTVQNLVQALLANTTLTGLFTITSTTTNTVAFSRK